MVDLLLIGLGGSIGAVLRYTFTKKIGERYQGDWPLATFLINIIGSFGIGLLYGFKLNQVIWLLLGTGFFGGFTTFSTYIYEAIFLMEEGLFWKNVNYLLTSIFTGVVFFAAGMWLANFFKGGV
ncbi:fluoride efflux transporter CrcB [Carboxydothermus ferrireducens]|uniref:Fluoride-specific ion channel FluC n=1 Tax=Carboxydothermus ferrireducens DSM 11255 TaxID=1119529 RepID=A0ABX2RCA7_9THEO|nr:fluoride efflux transporter CrcB [Carboxydothermus ferrireducens]NYE58816.1 CrcB protein [Carboxydothermus ferrireducens DSM 11255]